MITMRFTVSSFKENKIKEAKKALDVLKKGIQIRKLKENDINKSAIGDEKIDEYIKQHNFLLIDVENIPKKIDEFIKNEYRSWKTFFDVLQALSDRWKNAEHDDFFIKKYGDWITHVFISKETAYFMSSIWNMKKYVRIYLLLHYPNVKTITHSHTLLIQMN